MRLQNQSQNEGLYCRKPSAREIASVLGANTKHDGYFEGNGYQVTYTLAFMYLERTERLQTALES
jgi:hypothetical protein